MPPAEPSFTITQDIYKASHQQITVEPCHENDLTISALDDFVNAIEDGVVGLSAVYGARSVLNKLAISSKCNVIILLFQVCPPCKKARQTRMLLQEQILCNPNLVKQAFVMDNLVLSLFHDLRLRMSGAKDLISPSSGPAQPSPSVMATALGGTEVINTAAVGRLCRGMGRKDMDLRDLALQAWAARTASFLPSEGRTQAATIDTSSMDFSHMDILSKTHRHANRLRWLKPEVVKNDIQSDYTLKKGKLNVLSARYKTRIMQSNTLEICVKQGDRIQSISAKAEVNGRAASIAPKKNMPLQGSIISVKTIGREPPTNAETIRAKLLGQILRGTSSVLSDPLVQAIWLPGSRIVWPSLKETASVTRTAMPPGPYKLNLSQIKAVHAILSPDIEHRVVLIHGPPGTGKTTVIADSTVKAISTSAAATVWLVAHSNVAVKNIAEKLVQVGFSKFNIVVSKEFHFDWHEHLYPLVQHRLIRSDSLPKDSLSAARLILDSRVILCTLSTLLNDQLREITRIVPVKTLVIDEASQIELGDYLPVINRYSRSLRKLVFIGDDKQLAPYGYEDIRELESIFEKPHLRQNAVLLDTQYRMPIPIGNFISEHVYGGVLRSEHSLTSPKTCRFIDVKGKEEANGRSWVNIREAKTVISLVRTLVARGLSFKVITPYDAQRSLLENELKNEDLPFEDKCFNVDSFQGNESEHIIISLVRSGKLGFLKEQRRVNVMLTRCKKGMVICTSRKFINDIAKESLVGKLADHLGDKTWIEDRRVLYGNLNPFA